MELLNVSTLVTPADQLPSGTSYINNGICFLFTSSNLSRPFFIHVATIMLLSMSFYSLIFKHVSKTIYAFNQSHFSRHSNMLLTVLCFFFRSDWKCV